MAWSWRAARPRSSALLKAAQAHRVPVTARGGGLTTEGESVAYGGVLLDMTGMSRVLKIDREALTVRCEAGIYWHGLAEELRREGSRLPFRAAQHDLLGGRHPGRRRHRREFGAPRLQRRPGAGLAGGDAHRRDRRVLGRARTRNCSSA
jgi:hypothetical protein